MKPVFLIAFLIAGAGPVLAAPYDFVPVRGSTGGSGPVTVDLDATALNNAGQVLGSFRIFSSPLLQGVLEGGEVRQVSSGLETFNGLNDAGAVVGTVAFRRSTAIVQSSGRPIVNFAVLRPPAPPEVGPNFPYNTSGNGLNDSGQFVGTYLVDTFNPIRNSPTERSYVATVGGAYATLDVPGASDTLANSINEAGQVAGTYFTAGSLNTFGFIYDAGAYLTVGVPGAISTSVVAINDTGDVAGTYVDAQGRARGFTRAGGVFSDIVGTDGSTFLPVDLNNSGQVVGRFDGAGLSFFGTPQVSVAVPEPGTLALLGAGLVGCALRRRKA